MCLMTRGYFCNVFFTCFMTSNQTRPPIKGKLPKPETSETTKWDFPARQGGTPKTLDGLLLWKILHLEMDDDWGYLHDYGTPPNACLKFEAQKSSQGSALCTHICFQIQNGVVNFRVYLRD